MKRIFSMATFGILIGGALCDVSANTTTFQCPYSDQITVTQGKWSSGSVPGNWLGQGGANVDAFSGVQLTPGKFETKIQCDYKADNGKNPPAPLTGYVSIQVPFNGCTISDACKKGGSKGVDACEIECQNLEVKTFYCPDAAALKKSGPPARWYWDNTPPAKDATWQFSDASVSGDVPPTIECDYTGGGESGTNTIFPLLHKLPDRFNCTPDFPCYSPNPQKCPIKCSPNY